MSVSGERWGFALLLCSPCSLARSSVRSCPCAYPHALLALLMLVSLSLRSVFIAFLLSLSLCFALHFVGVNMLSCLILIWQVGGILWKDYL